MTASTPLPAEDDIPAGTQWPEPDTVVLLNRDLRPGTDPSRLSRFRDDQWDLNPAIFEDHATSLAMNFTPVPAALRPTAKFYVWQLLNHTEPRALRRANRARMAVRTVALSYNTLQFVLQWFAEHGVTELRQITQELLDDYLTALVDDEIPLQRCYRWLTEVRRLWAHRDLLPASMRLPDAPPWAGEDTRDLLGRDRRARENRTPRIGEPTMQMLLRWALRFLDFAEDILTAHAEHHQLHSRTPEQRRSTANRALREHSRHQQGQLKQKVATYLEGLRERGEALPGTRREDGRLEIRWRHLTAILDCSGSFQHTSTGRMVIESGLPIGEHTYLDTPITGLLYGQPWRSARIRYQEAPHLARLLSTACLIIVSYLSGARVGEVLNLRRGCITHDTVTGMWLMTGLYFKGAEDEDGNKIPEGQVRPDPWVVIEPVARAVAVLEQLHPSQLLFPRSLEPHRRRLETWKRQGDARNNHAITGDLEAFQTWVNTHCAQHGRTDAIPDDGRGPLAASRFRRTLAWFIRRRPRGLIAASIQYGHAHTRMLQGYAKAPTSPVSRTSTPSRTGSSARNASPKMRKRLARENTSAGQRPTPTATA